uniref:Uncharacterized protein n=1 Tax=Arundo donax TaxID=35708 RepID=A0A0A9AQG2_ARUDO
MGFRQDMVMRSGRAVLVGD